MRKWKYRIEHSPDQDRLNELGSIGWELVSVYKMHPENLYIKFVFKKELK